LDRRPNPLISVVIVNYKVPHALIRALHSLREADGYDRTEVIVVDNASGDESEELVHKEFPEVNLIPLKQNIGFGKACNVGARNATGTYLLFLNPDTLAARTTLSTSIAFMEQHPEVGLLGAKLLNPDGTLQMGCRRGFPTPATAFYRLSGLSRIFPKSKRFGRYNLTYLDPDLSCRVDAISGCFMFCRRALFESVQGFDERFFMYGEDLDLCWRINETGAVVWYHPEIRIIHLKGTSSAKRLLPSRINFYEAMILFSRKYQHIHRSFFPRWLINAAIIIQAVLNIGSKILRSLTATLMDLLIINATFAFCLTERFGYKMANPYTTSTAVAMIGVHVLLSASFLSMFVFNGVYSNKKSTPSSVLLSGFFASILFMACIYYLKFLAFSRIAFGIAALLIVLLLALWRKILPVMLRQGQRILYVRDSVIIIGNGRIPSLVIQNCEKQKTAIITGVLWTSEGEQPGQFEGYPVLGRIEDVAAVLKRFPVDVLLIATPLPWYSYIIEALAEIKRKNLTIRWVPRELFTLKAEEVPPVIPLHDFSV